MPRNGRIDALGALHHIISCGIEKKPIFLSDADRDWFVSQLGRVLTVTATACYAWALMVWQGRKGFFLPAHSGLPSVLRSRDAQKQQMRYSTVCCPREMTRAFF